MPRFRTKPLEFEAVQWFKDGDHPDVRVWTRGSDQLPELKTRQGYLSIDPGDWIITLPSGETYPCKSDVFAREYEPAFVPESSDTHVPPMQPGMLTAPPTPPADPRWAAALAEFERVFHQTYSPAIYAMPAGVVERR